jgi:uncharacterized protein
MTDSMNTTEQPGAFLPPTAEPPGRRKTEAEPEWTVSAAIIGLVSAVIVVLVVVTLIGVVYLAVGVDRPQDNISFRFASIAAQDLVMVAVAIALIGGISRQTPRKLGFRGFHPSALGWALLGFLTYMILSALYAQLVEPPDDDLLDQLGATSSTGLAILSGIFVIGVAPFVEELFFRGFVYQSLKRQMGVWGAALSSGLIFGAIHFKPEFLVPLAILGVLLALLLERTGSLWPCILVHGLNNALVFAISL